jgi:hypothetical protein
MGHDDIDALEGALAASELNARALVDGLGEALGTWRRDAVSWSVAQCLDHLANGHRVYLEAMGPAAERARQAGLRRRGPAVPGLVGAWFVRSLEPPVKTLFKMRAPRQIRPRSSPPLSDACARFLSCHAEVVQFLRTYSGIDLSHIVFPNPFITGVRFSLATGLHVLAAHERRHLWQAWRVRRAAEQAISALPRAGRRDHEAVSGLLACQAKQKRI